MGTRTLQRTDGTTRGASTGTSAYRGVTWLKRTGKWRAEIRHQGRGQHLGSFNDEGDAARAYDARARQLHGASARLNFPGEGERQGAALQRVDPQVKAANVAAVAMRQKQQRGTSAYRGVSWSKQTGKWVASIRHQGRQQFLGCFADEGDAARAYDVRAGRLHGASAKLNFPGEGERQGTARQRVDPPIRPSAAHTPLRAGRNANPKRPLRRSRRAPVVPDAAACDIGEEQVAATQAAVVAAAAAAAAVAQGDEVDAAGGVVQSVLGKPN
eukprot:COSAG01_NODE_4355_length_5108_cov_4.680176_1_plen_270_part_00